MLFENLKCLSPVILFCHDSSVLNSDYIRDFQKLSMLSENMQKDEISLMDSRKEKEQWKKETLQTVIWRCHTLHFWLTNGILALLPHFPAWCP